MVQFEAMLLELGLLKKMMMMMMMNKSEQMGDFQVSGVHFLR